MKNKVYFVRDRRVNIRLFAHAKSLCFIIERDLFVRGPICPETNRIAHKSQNFTQGFQVQPDSWNILAATANIVRNVEAEKWSLEKLFQLVFLAE